MATATLPTGTIPTFKPASAPMDLPGAPVFADEDLAEEKKKKEKKDKKDKKTKKEKKKAAEKKEKKKAAEKKEKKKSTEKKDVEKETKPIRQVKKKKNCVVISRGFLN